MPADHAPQDVDIFDDEEDEELTIHDDPRPFVEALIEEMDTFCRSLPLTAELSPLRNPYGPDLIQASVVLTDLFADVPGQGAGSQYISRLLSRCDEIGISVFTDADGPRSSEFYLARGFEPNTGPQRHQLVHYPPLPPGMGIYD